jgi:eukaryotic-like serine/threonine-protein kinase
VPTVRDSLNSAPYVGGRYRVVRVLGEGGMGVVAEVADRGSGERLALKRLHHGASALQASLFEREYRTLASLRHPRVVRVHEYGVDDDGPFYTMELLSGSDLAARAPMPWREVCACLRDAASILGLLHARELLHRDLTPRNLWQTPDGRLTLIDFGALTPFGATRQVIGTPAFVAPEVLKGGVLDQRTDLFALGALAYWLLTGTHAFRASDFSELHQLWQNAPAPPSSLAKHVRGADLSIPRALDELVTSLLRIDPSERPHGTSEVVSRLNAIAGLEPEPEDVVVPGYLESSAFVGRRRERACFSVALERASGGAPQCVMIEGPEGSGRSRLLAECATIARLSGALVLETEASPGGRPFHAALRVARGLVEALPLAARVASGGHAPVLADWAPELAARLGAEATPPPAPDVLSDRLRKQMALTSWLRAVARERTLVLLADDLERIDDESAGLLVTLVRDGDARILVLGACLEASQVTPPQSRSLRWPGGSPSRR